MADVLARGGYSMRQKDKNLVEEILEGEQVGYAYVYLQDGSKKQYVFDLTASNIANFIGTYQSGVQKIILTDMLDRLILDTVGGFIYNCSDQELCKAIIPILTPIQTGEAGVQEFPLVTRELFEEYSWLEDQRVTAAEISML